MLQAIEELPGQESPEIFGLHPNADLTFRTLQVQAAVQIIMDTRPKGGGSGGGLSREEVVDRICEDLLSKVGAAVCGKPSWSVCGDNVSTAVVGGTQKNMAETLRQPLLKSHTCDHGRIHLHNTAVFKVSAVFHDRGAGCAVDAGRPCNTLMCRAPGALCRGSKAGLVVRGHPAGFSSRHLMQAKTDSLFVHALPCLPSQQQAC